MTQAAQKSGCAPDPRSAYAPVIAEQARIRQDDQAALQRRHALRRARRRCDDLTELLGALDAHQSPPVAAQRVALDLGGADH